MNLLSGLEKFGFDSQKMDNLFEDEKKEVKNDGTAVAAEKKVQETDFLLEKAIRCPMCDKVFKTQMVKSGRLKRLEPDSDLRPRHQGIDSLKYDVSSCPFCGYTAINRYFETVTSVQRKLIEEGICSKFKPEELQRDGIQEYDYETALGRYKLSLFTAVVKKAPNSEKAFNCLKISWLLRGYAETVDESTEEGKAKKAEIQKEENAFYNQAFEGFMKAVSTEMFPMCGMDQTTVDYLLAAMAFRLNKLDVASKIISGIITSQTAPSRIKDKARNMKDEIVEKIKNSKA